LGGACASVAPGTAGYASFATFAHNATLRWNPRVHSTLWLD
jgi:hypothetical protein